MARQTETNGSDDALLDSIEKWLERDVRPYVLELDHADEYPFRMVEQMKELGLFGATISQEHGGLGLSATTYAKIVEKIAETWMSLGGIINSHLIMAADQQSAMPLPTELRAGLEYRVQRTCYQ